MTKFKYDITVKITQLVEMVKQENLLFFPLAIHLIFKALQKTAGSGKSGQLSYAAVNNKGDYEVVVQGWNNNFLDFYQDYIQKCYQCSLIDGGNAAHKPASLQTPFFYHYNVPNVDLDTGNPTIKLHPFTNGGGEMYLPLTLQCSAEIDIHNFSLLCQQLFQEFSCSRA